MPLTLTYIEHFDIKDKSVGLKEPSGLALSHDRGKLWIISDNIGRIFPVNLRGELSREEVLDVGIVGLEGIAIDPTGEFLFIVQESNNEIIKVRVTTGEVVARRRLSKMEGYDAIAGPLDGDDKNKGLEGITWDSSTNRLYLLKEDEPGMLIAIAPDLRTIHGHQVLSPEAGFVDDDVSGKKLDFSAVAYDADRNAFWIVSDKGQRLFLYDWAANQVIESAALGYTKRGDYREVEKAEGIALDLTQNRLYIVSDKEARLYIFEIGF